MYEDLVKYRKKIKNQTIESELVYAYAKIDRLARSIITFHQVLDRMQASWRMSW